MTTTTRRYVVSATLLAIFTLPVALSALPDMTPNPMESAKRWSHGLSDAQLRGYLDRIDTLRPERQRFVFERLSPAERSAFWRARHAGYLAGHPELTQPQRDLVAAASALVSPEFFENPKAFSAKHRQILEGLKKQFTKEQLVSVLGGAPTETKPGLLATAISRLREQVSVHAKTDPCECSHEMVFECPNCGSTAACTVVEEGCWTGYFSWGDCYGLCRSALPDMN